MATTQRATALEAIAVDTNLDATNVCIFRQERNFECNHLLMDFSQYGEDPDSAYGDEVYAQPSTIKPFLPTTTLTE